MDVRAARRTHPGRKRTTNEDYVAVWEPHSAKERARLGCLYVLADGVGGSAAGEVASRYAVEKVIHDYVSASGPSDPGAHLVLAVEAANSALHAYNAVHSERREMGTTLVAALVREAVLHVASAGDSRAYLVREGQAAQLTVDHTVTMGLLRRGDITPEQARDHVFRNQLTRCLGRDPQVVVDLVRRDLRPGDVLLLCSDGLTRHVDDDTIAQVVALATVGAAACKLVCLANDAGGTDNVSAVVVAVCDVCPRRGAGRDKGAPPEPDLDEIYRSPAHARTPGGWLGTR